MAQAAQVMILGAGEGRRLRPLTLERPKPLVPIGDRPLLSHLLEQLSASGYQKVVINTHHLARQLHEFDTGAVAVTWSEEAQLLGTAGGVSAARSHLQAPVLVYNADIYPPLPAARLRDAASEAGPVLLVSPPRRSSQGSGTVGLDERGQVVRLRGISFGDEVAQADYLGAMVLPRAVLEYLVPEGCLIGDVCIPWLQRGRPIFSVPHPGAWCDVGTLSGYFEANRLWLHRLGVNSWVGDDARVAGEVQCVGSVLGRGAEVSGTGPLERCVVWPGARIRAPLRDAVVTSSGRVVPREVG